MRYSGIVASKPVFQLNLMWRLGYAMTPDWKSDGYIVEIEGDPNVRCVLEVTEGAPTSGALATAMTAVNAIPVVAARPGTVRAWEIPPVVVTL